MFRRIVGCAVCLAFLIGFSGCAPAGADHPDTASVTGTVTYNGEAVEGATVSFSPAEAGGQGAIGKTDAQGSFTVQTQWGAEGAVPGSYKVSITKSEGHVTSDEDMETAQIGEDAAAAPVADALPAKYGSAGTSELTADVTADGENNFTFELTD